MRYLFSGLMRETGQPVEGHIEAANTDIAYDMLSDHGVVASSCVPDPKPLSIREELPETPELADALESALDSSSQQVAFDDLMDEYRGKKVWVIDRDKIRRRVSQVVDTAFHLSQTTGESHEQTQNRIRGALQGLFSDNRNLASERNASSVMGMRYNAADAEGPSRLARPSGSLTVHPLNAAPPPPVPQLPVQAVAANPAQMVAPSEGLDAQIARLSDVVSQAESVLEILRTAARGIGRGEGSGGSRRRSVRRPGPDGEKNDVLLTIYKSNVALLKAYKDDLQRSAG